MTVFAAPSMTLQQRLISHFAFASPTWISSVRVSDGADFLRYLIPMAMRNDMVMDCLLAIAAGDLGKIGGESVELQRLSHQHHGVATAALSSAIATEMASNHSGSVSPSPATTHGHRMRLDMQFAFQLFDWMSLQKHQSQGMLLGSSPELFYIILRLSVVLNNTPSLGSNHATLSELSSIEQDLERFSIDQTFTSHHRSDKTDLELNEAQLTSKLYYLACKLQLSQAMQPTAPISNKSKQKLVTAFFETLEILPIKSSANGVICWPLFIAGLSTITGKYRSAILIRLRTIETGWRSSIALQTSKYLTRQWKELCYDTL
ncbi:hypothetical protein BO71DRAFT_445303 [Aspergillus ellipticus CBS 707.79]|uniref:C6 transcription factor n=1 Tax=Aspergillus ellipticus CBS 707.79 TaxID=1448320 RepID=A0A319CSW0_9EURO|nr:hypothetical protein BO71DRAFT_445303 [Aspergillus ellipticus CBS 707.79]